MFNYSNSTTYSRIMCRELAGELTDSVCNWSHKGKTCDKLKFQLNWNLARQQWPLLECLSVSCVC